MDEIATIPRIRTSAEAGIWPAPGIGGTNKTGQFQFSLKKQLEKIIEIKYMRFKDGRRIVPIKTAF
jgi:hypothetical protein